jgi:DNA-directed RNA polymerase subunit L
MIKIKKNKIDNYNFDIDLEGNDVNHVIINTLRRVILSLIPVYAYNIIDIKKNTSVFNNDQIRLRINNFPVFNIKNKKDTLQHIDRLKRNFYNKLDMNDFSDKDQDLPSLENITMYCDAKNEKEELLNVTTDMCKFYNEEEEIKNIYDKPLLICKLKKNEEINFTAKTVLGFGLVNSIWTTTDNCPFDEIDENKFNFKFTSEGQIKAKDIFERAINIIINMLNKYKKLIVKNNQNTDDNKGEIIIDNEDHTLGNLISRSLQNHKNIEFAGYKVKHLLIKEIIIKYITNGGKSFNDIIKESIDYTIKIYEKILSLI